MVTHAAGRARIAVVDTRAVLANLAALALDVGARGDTDGRRVVVARLACLTRAALRLARVRQALTGGATDLVAVLAGEVEAVQRDAGARRRTVVGAGEALVARDSVAGRLASRGIRARTLRDGQAALLGGRAGRSAQRVARRVGDLRVEAVVGAGVLYAVRTEELARLALVDGDTRLAAGAGLDLAVALLRALAAEGALHAGLALAAQRRAVGVLVVLHAVAVVVLAVALLGDGVRLALADDRAEHALVGARLADAFALTTRVADVHGGRRVGVRAARDGVGADASGLVHAAVAVVVDAVADLGAGPDSAHADALPVLCALRHALLARQVRAVAGVDAGVVDWIAGGARDAVVDHAVAVVVEAVADLGRRRHIAEAVEHARCALYGPGRALPHVRAADLPDLRQIAVVDAAVAVVVDAVAALGGGSVGADAGPALGARARQRSVVTRRCQAPVARAGAACGRVPAEVLEHAVAARQVPAAVLTRGGRVREGDLVGRAVAVVVDAVTHLGLRVDAALADDGAVHASRHSGGARRRIEAAGLADAEGRLVHLTVAVVVDPVADLGARTDEADALTAALLRALFALAVHAVIEVGGLTRGHTQDGRDAVVDDAVAVVVDAVADLGLRAVRARAEAAAREARAGLTHRLTREGARRGARAVHGGESAARDGHDALVDDAVAVVVAAVADLGGGGDQADVVADRALVGLAVAVVVRRVADLHRRAVRRVAARERVLVDLDPVAVVVEPLSQVSFPGIVAEPDQGGVLAEDLAGHAGAVGRGLVAGAAFAGGGQRADALGVVGVAGAADLTVGAVAVGDAGLEPG